MEDIFVVQDEVTQQIVEALRVKLSPAEQDRLGGPSTRNMEAYDFTLRGRDLAWRFTPEANTEAPSD